MTIANHDGTFTNKVPMFMGTNYTFWKVRMKNYIMSLGTYVWDIMQNGYKHSNLLIDKYNKLEFTYNAKTMNSTLVICLNMS